MGIDGSGLSFLPHFICVMWIPAQAIILTTAKLSREYYSAAITYQQNLSIICRFHEGSNVSISFDEKIS